MPTSVSISRATTIGVATTIAKPSRIVRRMSRGRLMETRSIIASANLGNSPARRPASMSAPMMRAIRKKPTLMNASTRDVPTSGRYEAFVYEMPPMTAAVSGIIAVSGASYVSVPRMIVSGASVTRPPATIVTSSAKSPASEILFPYIVTGPDAPWLQFRIRGDDKDTPFCAAPSCTEKPTAMRSPATGSVVVMLPPTARKSPRHARAKLSNRL